MRFGCVLRFHRFMFKLVIIIKVYLTRVLDKLIIYNFYWIIFLLNSITYPKELKKAICFQNAFQQITLYCKLKWMVSFKMINHKGEFDKYRLRSYWIFSYEMVYTLQYFQIFFITEEVIDIYSIIYTRISIFIWLHFT